ncbi:glycosyltransferase family 2 protein [Stenotrophomonas sp. OVS01A]|uniref:glycosyltransferase family 2 protein n=1 Tax=Stenotrophomonas sp. OVS01A TaxID=2862680 RepID=UPI001CBF6C8F|nr:glycosyltransferase family 2 protein [Stenotrophomonas sp. OVS01A]
MEISPDVPRARLLSLVMPAYNEEEGIAEVLAIIDGILDGSTYRWELVLVNDGSRDGTLAAAGGYQPRNFALVLVDLSRNFGKEAALSAGLEVACGDAIIPMDADLQDPPELIFQMLPLWESGAEVVLAKRADRSSDGVMKRMTAGWFYRTINHISDVAIPENVGDFRLMDRVVVDVIRRMPESRRFMKGLFAWAGFRTVTVEYIRPERLSGQTKFNGMRLINLAVEGITSFSTAPLRLATYLGAVVAVAAFLFGVYVIIHRLTGGVAVPGYASLASMIAFFSGVQLLAIGVIGEYVGRTYIESKMRPAFVVRSIQRL